MIICVCKAISDRHIRAAVKDGATSMRDLTRHLGVGSCCGKCLPEAKATLGASLGNSLGNSLGQRGDAVAPACFPNSGPEFAV